MARKYISYEEFNSRVRQAMGQPTSSVMDSFNRFLSNRGTQQGAQPRVPQLPKEQIKRLPMSTIPPQ